MRLSQVTVSLLLQGPGRQLEEVSQEVETAVWVALDEVMSVSPAIGAPLLAQKVKRLPTMRETWI